MTEQWSALWWLYQGGWVMIPLLLLSVIGAALTLERFNALKRKRLLAPDFMQEVRTLWSSASFAEIERLCGQTPTPLAKIIQDTLSHRKSSGENLEAVLERNGQLQSQVLLKNLRPLGAIASLAPMLGLLGTVVGMIKAFHVVAQGDPNLVAQSIAQALITTAVGLVIGILALFFYHYFRGQAEHIGLEMESFVRDLFRPEG